MSDAAAGTADWPPVSVIVAAYNAAATLEACLTSLRRLDYPAERLEVIAVDNASTDATPRILAAHAAWLRVCRESRRGPAAARNRGLDVAGGAVVALTDADCTVEAQWLRHLVAPLRDAAVGVVGGRILSRRPCNRIEAFGECIHDHARALHEFRPPYAITMNWAARRAVLDAVGRFDPTLLRGSDVEWSWRLGAAGYRLAYAPDAVVYHRNERTPWGLMHEGYTHAVHAAPIRVRHADWLRQVHATRPSAAIAVARATPHWSDPLWRALFNTGKRLGRAHATWQRRG